MRHRAAQNDRVQETVGREVVDILSAASQKPQILDAFDRAPDNGIVRALLFHPPGVPTPFSTANRRRYQTRHRRVKQGSGVVRRAGYSRSVSRTSMTIDTGCMDASMVRRASTNIVVTSSTF